MKTLSLLILTLFFTISVMAQPWSEPTVGNIYYQGNVGIGTTNPGAKLGIESATTSTNGILILGDRTNVGGKSIYFSRPSSGSIINIQGSEYGVGGANLALQATGGYVGIGTTNPGHPLHIYSPVNQPVKIEDSGASVWLDLTTNAQTWSLGNWAGGTFRIYNRTLGTSPFVVDYNNGNVGIGTANPVDKLHVSGGDIGIDQPYAFKFANGQSIRDNSGGGLAINSNTYKLQLIGGTDPTNGLIEVLTNNAIRMTVLNNGNVGIGTTLPGAILHVYNNSSTAPLDMSNTSALTLQNPYTTAGNTGSAIFFKSDTRGYNTFAGIGGNMIGADANGAYGDIVFGTKATSAATTLSERMRISSGGNVGIGTTTPEAKLTVKGKIVASEIQVKDIGVIADYVFKPDYQLMSLEKVEEFVKQNQHLPEVPSEKEFKKDGMNVAEMNALLLKKVEELTLYAIKQNKKAEEQNRKVEELTLYSIDQNKSLKEQAKKIESLEKTVNNLNSK